MALCLTLDVSPRLCASAEADAIVDETTTANKDNNTNNVELENDSRFVYTSLDFGARRESSKMRNRETERTEIAAKREIMPNESFTHEFS